MLSLSTRGRGRGAWRCVWRRLAVLAEVKFRDAVAFTGLFERGLDFGKTGLAGSRQRQIASETEHQQQGCQSQRQCQQQANFEQLCPQRGAEDIGITPHGELTEGDLALHQFQRVHASLRIAGQCDQGLVGSGQAQAIDQRLASQFVEQVIEADAVIGQHQRLNQDGAAATEGQTDFAGLLTGSFLQPQVLEGTAQQQAKQQ